MRRLPPSLAIWRRSSPLSSKPTRVVRALPSLISASRRSYMYRRAAASLTQPCWLKFSAKDPLQVLGKGYITNGDLVYVTRCRSRSSTHQHPGKSSKPSSESETETHVS
jgi:hypothetical protein